MCVKYIVTKYYPSEPYRPIAEFQLQEAEHALRINTVHYYEWAIKVGDLFFYPLEIAECIVSYLEKRYPFASYQLQEHGVSMEHIIENTEDGFKCTVCTWAWKTKPRSSCPGVVRYQWLAAPENLKTESQLKKKKLHHGPVRGIVGDYHLFDVNEATPWTSEERAAERERNRQKCIHCGKMVSRGYWNAEYEACKKCLQAAIEKHNEECRLRREAMEREFQEMLVSVRDEEILWARDLLGRSDWVILDCETTGLETYVDEVISIAVIAADGSELLNTLIMPANPIHPEATQINGITDEMVADAPTFAEVWAQLVDLLNGRLVIAYNVDFDENMLAGTRSRYRDQIEWDWEDRLGSKWQCAMLAYAAYFGQWHDYWKSFTWQPLPRGNHQAAGDCHATLEMIKRMAESKLSTELDTGLVSAGAVPGEQEIGENAPESGKG